MFSNMWLKSNLKNYPYILTFESFVQVIFFRFAEGFNKAKI